VGVAQINLEGKVELANDRYCDVVGYERERLVGKGTQDITHRQDLQEQFAMLPRLSLHPATIPEPSHLQD